jgi:hypothetical protein
MSFSDKFTLFLWAAAVLLFTSAVKADNSQKAQLEAYLADELRVYPKRLRKAKQEYIPIILELCDEQKWDPLFIAVNITRESSWIAQSKGKIGEVGLMQVHGAAVRVARKLYPTLDLSTARGQITTGVTWFSHCRKMCGDDFKRILAGYMTGSCENTGAFGVGLRMRKYKEAVKKYRRREHD